MAYERDDYAGRTSGLTVGLALIAGAAIGVGLGLLFAPKSGAALRRDIARRARDLQDEAGEQYDRVAAAAADLTERGRDVTERARSAVATGIREARRYASEVADAADGLNR